MSCVTTASAMPRSWTRSRSSSRICACTETSSAVVGSSAISSFGSQASAIAIMARWRMPPDSSCGYWRSRRGTSLMRTCPSRFRGARARVDCQLMPRCATNGSAIWSPMRRCGVSEVIGSWKIIDTLRPRNLRGGRSEQRRAFEPRVAGYPRLRRQQPHQRQEGLRLARARFADHAEATPRRDLEATRRRPPAGCRRPPTTTSTVSSAGSLIARLECGAQTRRPAG